MPRLQGVIVPMVTPFTSKGDIDYDAFEWLCRRLSEAGVTALFPNSSTGEWIHLTQEEAVRLVRVAVNAAPSDMTILPGASSNRTDDSVRLAREFVNLGADGIIVLPPFFFRSTAEVMYRHFSTIANAVSVPVLIYNNPLNTGVNVPVDVVVRLAREHSNVIGVKVTSNDFAYIVELIREAREVNRDFSVFTGLDYMTLGALSVGADGVVGGLANILPEVHVTLVRSWFSGDYDTTVKVNEALLTLSRLYWFGGEGAESPAIIKAALEALGSPVKRFVREPLRPLNDDEIGQVKEVILRTIEEAKEAGVALPQV